jgi:hypothetical protein
VSYLDYNATTPVAPEVLGAIRPCLERQFGNPSSAHAYGVAASAAGLQHPDLVRDGAESLGSQARAAGPQLASGDRRDDPAPRQRRELLGLTHHQASVSRGADERIRERVLGVALDSGHQRQQVVLGRPVEADDVCELRQSLGERAGLVDGHRLHAREILQSLAALDEHALARD